MGIEEENSAHFGTLDNCVFAAMFIVTGVIGIYTSSKGNKTPEEFFMGNRSLKPLPVAMSLLTSYVSAISYLGISGEVYAHGMQYGIFVLGATLALICAVHFILPTLYPLNLTSINEYIELRFRSKRLRTFISIISLVKTILHTSVLLYAPTIALTSVTKFSILTHILLLGIITTIYSAFGGVRAVIWTDVFHLCVMLTGSALVLIIGCFQCGGLINVLYISSKGGRLEMFDMTLSPFVRHTFFNVLISHFFAYGFIYCSEQINLQRMCAVKSIEDARNVLKYKICGMILVYFLIFTGGLVAYATYFGCDPMALGIIKKKEEIMTYYISDKLSFIPGLPGLFVATLIGGTLSTLSSVINSCVALIWRDFCLSYSFFKTASSRKAMLTNKILSLFVGALVTGLATLASKTHSLIEFANTMIGPFVSSIFGIFIIAYFFPKCNLKGVWTGSILCFTLSLWKALVNLLYKEPPEMLPFSAEECAKNLVWKNASVVQNFTLTTSNDTEDSINNRSFLEVFRRVSYMWIIIIGPLSCILTALFVSFLTGNQNIKEVSPKYICKSVHKFYWKKEELEEILAKDVELENYSRIVHQKEQSDQ